MVPCERWVTMATIVNNRQQYMAKNISHTCLLKLTKFRCTVLSGLRAMKKSLVWKATLCHPRPAKVNLHNKGIISLFIFSRHRIIKIAEIFLKYSPKRKIYH